MSRMKVRALTTLLGLVIAVGGATPVAAGQPSVRLPKSAADWATYTQAEKAATMHWVWDQQARMIADGTWTWTDAPATDMSGGDSLAPAAVTGGVNCSIKTNQQPFGTYATGWASTYTTGSVSSISTGLTGMDNKLWHNNTLFSYGWGSGASGTYTYSESSQDFKFSWDTVTWQVQSWGSAMTSSTVYLFKNKYCGKSVAG